MQRGGMSRNVTSAEKLLSTQAKSVSLPPLAAVQPHPPHTCLLHSVNLRIILREPCEQKVSYRPELLHPIHTHWLLT